MNFEQFEFYEEIGRGGFGKVKRAKNKENEQIVSIKIIDLRSTQIPETKLHSEIELCEILNHPFITRYFGSFKKDQKYYIVNEYVDGGDLEHFIMNRKEQKLPIPENFIIKIFIQVLLGLKYMHELKCIHRDIKPRNILVSLDGNIKITDFGLSKFNESSFLSSFNGTFAYTSPEMLSQKYSFPTDIWSLGCSLYQMMSFNLPFEGSEVEIIDKVRKSNPRNITENYSKDLKTLIPKLLNKIPEKRITINEILSLPFLQNSLSSVLSMFSLSLNSSPQISETPLSSLLKQLQQNPI